MTQAGAATGKTIIGWHEMGASRELPPGTIGQYWSFVEPEDDAAELTPLVRRAGRQRHPLARRRRLPRHEVRRRPAERARPHARARLGEGADHARRGVPLGAVRHRARPRRARHPRRRGADLDRDARLASRTWSSWRSRASSAIAEIAWSPAPAAGAARDTDAFFGRVARLGERLDAMGVRTTRCAACPGPTSAAAPPAAGASRPRAPRRLRPARSALCAGSPRCPPPCARPPRARARSPRRSCRTPTGAGDQLAPRRTDGSPRRAPVPGAPACSPRVRQLDVPSSTTPPSVDRHSRAATEVP